MKGTTPPRIPAGLFYGMIHLAAGGGIAVGLSGGIWGPLAYVLVAFALATAGFAIHYGPCLGLAGILVMMGEEIWLGAASRRLSGGAIFYLGALVPLYLSSGFRAVAARRGPFELGARVRPPLTAGRSLSAEEVGLFLLTPLAALGVALPAMSLLRRRPPSWISPLANPKGYLATWAILAIVVVAGIIYASIRLRKMDPRAARLVLVEIARSWTRPIEGRIWRRLVRAREKRGRIFA